MKTARSILSLLLLCALAASARAQEAEVNREVAPPEPSSLEQNWWDYFEGSAEQTVPRIDAFLEQVNAQIPGLGAQNQEVAPTIVEALSDNLQVYLSLLDDPAIERQSLPEPAGPYSIDALLGIAAGARAARAAADSAEAEVEREQRILDGASRRRDALFKDYLDAADGDERWLAGLRLVRARTAQAISARRLVILTQGAESAVAYAIAAAARVELVQQRLGTDVDAESLASLVDVVRERADAVAAAEEREREA
ncbi:MAG: hypothetical protein OEM63_07890, partial [Gammaproteobacteria bacterium]|nr:hypothetical protein [Gammaproteobacteria bacterium]